MGPHHRQARDGRAFGRHHARNRSSLCRIRRRFHIGGRDHALRPCRRHSFPSGAGLTMSFDIELVKASLPDRRLDWYPTIGSTMTEASRLAASGYPSGTVVGADEQTAGLGRYGRIWHSESGFGLYVSVVLRYAVSPDYLKLA